MYCVYTKPSPSFPSIQLLIYLPFISPNFTCSLSYFVCAFNILIS